MGYSLIKKYLYKLFSISNQKQNLPASRPSSILNLILKKKNIIENNNYPEEKYLQLREISISELRRTYIKHQNSMEQLLRTAIQQISILAPSDGVFIGELSEPKKMNIFVSEKQTNPSENPTLQPISKSIFSFTVPYIEKHLKLSKATLPTNDSYFIEECPLPLEVNPSDPLSESGYFLGIPLNDTKINIAFIGLYFEKSGKDTSQGIQNFDFSYLKPFLKVLTQMIKNLQLEKKLAEQKRITYHNSKLASLGELAAGVGHEINNPLTIINGYLSTLNLKAEKNGYLSKEELFSYSQKMEKAIYKIADIVKGLRAFSRQDSDDFENFDVINALEESLDLIREIYAGYGIQVDLSVLPYLSGSSQPLGSKEKRKDLKAFVLGNRGQFQQVIMNLLSNSKYAIKDSEEKFIKISAHISKNSIKILMEDSGPGVSENLKEKIFDPFFTTKGIHDGTGIGLSLSHKIICDHSGIFKLEDSLKGALFSIELPLTKTDSSNSPQISSRQPNESVDQNSKLSPNHNSLIEKTSLNFLSHLHFMLVDDEKDILDFVSNILEGYGATVETFKNGQLALANFQEHPEKYHLVISDIRMPVMNGLQLLKKIVNIKKDIPFLFITGDMNVNFETEDSTLKKYVNGVLYKPFQENQIIELILKTLKDYQDIA